MAQFLARNLVFEFPPGQANLCVAWADPNQLDLIALVQTTAKLYRI